MQHPYRPMTERIINKIIPLNVFQSLKVLIDFVITFYDNEIITSILPMILQYCQFSLEFCIDTLALFDEIQTIFFPDEDEEDSPIEDQHQLQQFQITFANFSFEYLKIVLPFCVVKSIDDEVIEIRSKLRGSFMTIKSMICFFEHSKFEEYLKFILSQNQGNLQVLEAVCFIWDSADRLPQELKQVTIYRPEGFESF